MKNTIHKIQVTGGLIVALLILFNIPSGQAMMVINENNSGEVINNVSVQANSGGQTVVNGEAVTTGDSNAQVKIKTEIDGQTVQDIDETASGDNARIEVKSAAKAEDGQAEVNTEINNQGEKSETEEMIILDSDDDDINEKADDTDDNLMNDEDKEEVSSEVVELFTSFWQSIAQFFTNIFSIFK